MRLRGFGAVDAWWGSGRRTPAYLQISGIQVGEPAGRFERQATDHTGERTDLGGSHGRDVDEGDPVGDSEP